MRVKAEPPTTSPRRRWLLRGTRRLKSLPWQPSAWTSRRMNWKGSLNRFVVWPDHSAKPSWWCGPSTPEGGMRTGSPTSCSSTAIRHAAGGSCRQTNLGSRVFVTNGCKFAMRLCGRSSGVTSGPRRSGSPLTNGDRGDLGICRRTIRQCKVAFASTGTRHLTSQWAQGSGRSRGAQRSSLGCFGKRAPVPCSLITTDRVYVHRAIRNVQHDPSNPIRDFRPRDRIGSAQGRGSGVQLAREQSDQLRPAGSNGSAASGPSHALRRRDRGRPGPH